jgi:hypothetical protein
MKDHDNFGLENILQDMTAKQYASIHLKVPRSGDKELDDMIRESRRAEFAKAALTGLMLTDKVVACGPDTLAAEAGKIGAAMLAEWEKEVEHGED